MKQVQLLRIIVEEKALLKVLKTIGNQEYHTREILKRVGAYGYGHKLLLEAEKKGLVKRRIVKNRMYNKLTRKGQDVIKLAKQIGV